MEDETEGNRTALGPNRPILKSQIAMAMASAFMRAGHKPGKWEKHSEEMDGWVLTCTTCGQSAVRRRYTGSDHLERVVYVFPAKRCGNDRLREDA